jgi:predicted ArsR family transcriptional regulator
LGDDDSVAMGNCSFGSLAHAHREIICGMDLSLVTGLLSGLQATRARAIMVRQPGRCCVALCRA